MNNPTQFYSPVEAIAAGAKRYFGNLCALHPDSKGERNAKNRGCITCNMEKMRKRRAANPEYHRKATRAAYEKWYAKNKKKISDIQRKRSTGIDGDLYERLLQIQGNCCAICKASFGTAGVRAHADHCHDSGKARGVLCSTCNQAEGLIKRSGLSAAEFGKRLSDYLLNPPAKKAIE